MKQIKDEEFIQGHIPYQSPKDTLENDNFITIRDYQNHNTSVTGTSPNTQRKSARINSNTIEYEKIIERMTKEKRKMEKELNILIDNLRKNELTIDELRKDNLKLRASLEKVEYQKKSSTTMLQKLNEDVKIKDEQLKKQIDYSKKLEMQLLKGSLHHSLYEENKKIKEKLNEIEDDNKVKEKYIEELNKKINNLTHDNELIRCALEINLIELNEKLNEERINLKDLLEYTEGKNKINILENDNQALKIQINEYKTNQDNFLKEIKKASILLENQAVELESYKQAIREAHDEKLTIIKKNDDFNESMVKKDTQIEQLNDQLKKINIEKADTEEKLNDIRIKYEDISRSNLKRLEEFEVIVKENNEIKHANLELDALVKNLTQKIKDMENSKLGMNIISPKYTKEIHEKELLDKNSLIEKLRTRIQNYEKSMKDITQRYVKLEEVFIKTQDVNYT